MSLDWPWPAPADDGAARHLKRGTRVPSIALPATAGGRLDVTKLAGWVAVCFYTWTGRPGVDNLPGWDHIAGAHGSTPQLEGLKALHAGFRACDSHVVAVSTQAPPWQAEMACRLALPFPVLSDVGLELTRALRLPTFTAGDMILTKRLTLVIRHGRVDRAFYPIAVPPTHPREVLTYISDLLGD